MGKPQLTGQQKYLLERLPSKYQLRAASVQPPTQVKKAEADIARAKKVIEAWDKKADEIRCRHDRKMQALLEKARESIYFAAPEKALAIVQQVEKMVKGCAEA